MRGALKSIEYVSSAVGHHTPVTPAYYTGINIPSLIFMDVEKLSIATAEDPEWVDDMCRVASDFSMDWIRAQYEAGAQNWLYLADFFGTEMISPSMAERFISPYVIEMSEMVQKEFGQRVFYHTHGNQTRPKSLAWLEKLAKDAKLIGYHLDKYHDAKWVKENIRDKMQLAAGIPFRGGFLDKGPLEQIQEETEKAIDIAAPGGGIIVVPTGQVLPSTPNEHFKGWIDAVHKYGRYPIGSWRDEA
jgi:uroporphyrinogen-III decarboxylase